MKVNNKQAQDLKNFFSGFAGTWDGLYGGKRHPLTRWFDHTFRRDIYERYELTFAQLGPDLRGKSLLDIGCGSGIYCFEAVARGADMVVGLDIAEGMIALCNHQSQKLGLGDKVKFIVGEFPMLAPVPELQRKFDIAVVMGVMDYILDPVPFLMNLRKQISGYAVISFPGKDWLRWQLRRWRYKLLGRCAIIHYREAEVREFLEEAGFKKLTLTYLPHSGGCYFVKADA